MTDTTETSQLAECVRDTRTDEVLALIERHVTEFEESMKRLEASIEDPVNTDAGRDYDMLKLHGQRGAKFALRRLESDLRAQLGGQS